MASFTPYYVAGDSTGSSDPHYQVFIELKGLRNLTEKQRYKVIVHLFVIHIKSTQKWKQTKQNLVAM